MNGIDNKLSHEGRLKDNNFWQSIIRAVKKSFVPMVSLAMITILLQVYLDYRVDRLAIMAIIFIITLEVSVGE